LRELAGARSLLKLALLTQEARVVTSFHRGDVAERLKAAVC
jgi:hypothetical protein